MEGLCEGGNEPPGSLKAICTMKERIKSLTCYVIMDSGTELEILHAAYHYYVCRPDADGIHAHIPANPKKVAHLLEQHNLMDFI
ncbi:hypothetical protein ANN_20428 [Periplaneta americana]|uniref:Uncharacterized protein n=1 Tax=Periplaneta americana TaxID=6978 RepID=A0ABQ8SCW5_PERAM|nr:hypothetical protein ANN_20428 [Periplaneta americana]